MKAKVYCAHLSFKTSAEEHEQMFWPVVRNENLYKGLSRCRFCVYGHERLSEYERHNVQLHEVLLATSLVIVNHGQVMWTIPEQAPPCSNYHTTPTGGRLSSQRIQRVSLPLQEGLMLIKSVVIQSPTLGMVWQFGEVVLVQVSSSSLDRGLKLRGPSPEQPSS
ncbi:hypothetical protein TNCV_5123351 [Trichonephila clavipes]|nr:hypothetical protein TNCV_5123351 [Trichonephila clavipes]